MLFYILYNQNLSPEDAVVIFLITIIVFFVSISVHEFAHGYVAYKMGDLTPKLAGRLTLNPFKHLDVVGFVCFILLGVGWAKPMPINPLNFKKYKKGIRWVSLAGILSNIALGLIASLVCLFTYLIISKSGIVEINTTLSYFILFLQYFMTVNSFLALFNILPIYPLDGFNFIATYLKADSKYLKFNLKNGMRILIIILLASSVFELITGIDLMYFYLNLLYNYVFYPISLLGVL